MFKHPYEPRSLTELCVKITGRFDAMDSLVFAVELVNEPFRVT